MKISYQEVNVFQVRTYCRSQECCKKICSSAEDCDFWMLKNGTCWLYTNGFLLSSLFYLFLYRFLCHYTYTLLNYHTFLPYFQDFSDDELYQTDAICKDSNRMKIFEAADFRNGNIKIHSLIKTWQECADLCFENSACIYFSFQVSLQRCWLKVGIMNPNWFKICNATLSIS